MAICSSIGRILYFNKDGSLRWTYVNRSKNPHWSRVIDDPVDMKKSSINFLKSKTSHKNFNKNHSFASCTLSKLIKLNYLEMDGLY